MDTDRHRQTGCNSQEGQYYCVKEYVLPLTDDHPLVGGPMTLNIWATHTGLWGIIKPLEDIKLGRGGSGRNYEKWEIKMNCIKIVKELMKHIKCDLYL